MSQADNYFNSLNYSLANEDVAFELAICRQLKPNHILTICGSGARFLPLASVQPQRITALDLAPQQLALAELRQVLMQNYPLDDYLRFFGYPPYTTDDNQDQRRELFETLPLRAPTREYFLELFSRLNWKGLLYEGRWEKTFTGIPKRLRKVIGGAYDNIFNFFDQEAQDRFFAKKLQDPLWKLIPGAVLLLVGNASFFNAVLYRGNFVRKNIEETYFQFYSGVFRRLFANGLTRENFFLQICFLGRLKFPEGNPVEVHPAVYQAAQQAMQAETQVDFVLSDVLSFSEQTKHRYDFVSLSDAPSYFTGEAERNYLQALSRCLNRGARVVVRHYLHIPEQTDTTGYNDVSEEYRDLAAQEKMQVYKIFVYEYIG